MSSEFRHLVRIRGKDLDGAKKLVAALSDIKGIGFNYSRMLVSNLALDPKMRTGFLTEAQVKEIERALQDTSSLKIPQWAFNRRKDPETGETKQLIGPDLDFAVRNDIEAEKNIQSWKGIRHSLGLKVRGQRTRTTGRKGRTVGVRKTALAAAAAAARAEEKK